jgi:hypothetical protein
MICRPDKKDKKYRHKFGIFNTYCFSVATMVMWTWFNVTLCTHCLSCSDLWPYCMCGVKLSSQEHSSLPVFLLVTYLNVTESLWLSVTAHTVKQGTSNIQENYQVIWKWEWQNSGMILIFSWHPLSHHMEPQEANATQSGKQCYPTREHSYHTAWCYILADGNFHNHCNKNFIASAKHPHVILSSHNGVYLDCGRLWDGTPCSLVDGYHEI